MCVDFKEMSLDIIALNEQYMQIRNEIRNNIMRIRKDYISGSDEFLFLTRQYFSVPQYIYQVTLEHDYIFLKYGHHLTLAVVRTLCIYRQVYLDKDK